MKHWRSVLGWGLILACGVLIGRLRGADPTPADTDAPRPIRLIIDYGDGVEKHFTQIPWRQEMTVYDVLRVAQSHRRGIRIQARGAGETLFITQIDDLKNEGRGRNWVFRVNAQLATRSCGVVPVKPGDAILWRFGEYR